MPPSLLFLCHRIPYPPNKGDKIRSWHVLEFLSRKYRIHLGAFIDDPGDWKHVPKLESICESCHFVELAPWKSRFRSLVGLGAGRPLTLPYYASSSMRKWVRGTLKAQEIDRAFLYSSAMAQYLPEGECHPDRIVIDFVDIDSDKWGQYARSTSWPINWIYRREAEKLLAYEREVSARFFSSLFVSRAESELFKVLSPENSEKIGYYNNGVDAEYFSPCRNYASPYSTDEKVLVFTGAMDYWPNADAVAWFAKAIFPSVHSSIPAARFYVVGSNPSPSVLALRKIEGVEVTGRVHDVRPYLRHASLAIAPMRIARGIQNKVLEAMAMAKPVITSPQGIEGINAEPGAEVLVAHSERDYVNQVQNVLKGCYPDLGSAARNCIKTEFNWDKNLLKVAELLG